MNVLIDQELEAWGLMCVSLRDQEKKEEVAEETEQHPGRQGETQKGLMS